MVDDLAATKAGVHSGDILLKIAGRDVPVRYAEEIPLLNQMVADLPVGQEVEELVVQRDGQEKTLKLTTAEREQYQRQRFELEQWTSPPAIFRRSPPAN